MSEVKLLFYIQCYRLPLCIKVHSNLQVYVHHRILSPSPQFSYALIEVWRIVQLLALKLPSSLQLLTLCQVPPDGLEDSHYVSAAYCKHQICRTCTLSVQPPVFSSTFIKTFPLSTQVGSAYIDAYNPFRSQVLKFSVILEWLFHVSSRFFLQIYLFPLYQQHTSFFNLFLYSVFLCSKVSFLKSYLLPCCYVQGVTASCRAIRSKSSFLWALFSYP